MHPADAAALRAHRRRARGRRHRSAARSSPRARVTAAQRRGSVFVPDALDEPLRVEGARRRAGGARGRSRLRPARPEAHALRDPPVRRRRGRAFAVTRARPAPDCAYWAMAPADGGYRIELAGDAAPAGLEGLRGGALRPPRSTTAAEWVAYTDRATGAVRLAAFAGDEVCGALFVGAGGGLDLTHLPGAGAHRRPRAGSAACACWRAARPAPQRTMVKQSVYVILSDHTSLNVK